LKETKLAQLFESYF